MSRVNILISLVLAASLMSCEKEADTLCPCDSGMQGSLCREYLYTGSEYSGHIDYSYSPEGRLLEKKFFSSGNLEKLIRWEYLETGKPSKESVFNGDGNMLSYTVSAYNAFDSLASQTNYENGTAVSKTLFEYGNNNLLAAKTSYVNETVTKRFRFIYDGSGKLYRIDELDASGNLLSSGVYTSYSNNVTRIEYYDRNGEYQGYDITSADAHGNIIQYSRYGADDSLVSYITYIYNSGRLVKRSEFSGNGKLKSYTLFQYS